MVGQDGRQLKKLRRRQRAWLEDIADALLDAERRASEKDWGLEAITAEDMEKVEREGLCSQANLELFIQWHSFGGRERGLSLTELTQMPAHTRKDFHYILSIISARRKDRERMDTLFPEEKKKKGKPNARPGNRRR